MNIKSRLIKWLLPSIKRELLAEIRAREQQSVDLLQHSRTMLEDLKRIIDGEMAALYFTFPGRKRVPVKTVLVKLMEYLDIQIATRQNAVTGETEVYVFKYKGR